MATEPLARMAGSPARLATIIETAALADGVDPHDEMLVRVTADRVDTPASAPDAEQVSFCTARAARFDDLAMLAGESVQALFRVAPTLAWLDWFGERHDHVDATFVGSHGVATRVQLRAGEDTVRVPCATDWKADALSYAITDRFDGETVRDPDGEPLPIHIETDASELRRLVRAAELAECGSQVPVVVEDGSFRIDVEDESAPDGTACVEGTLDATVEGPDCRNRYGHGLVRVVSAVQGDLDIRTGPGEALAIVKDREDYTLRYLVRPRSRIE